MPVTASKKDLLKEFDRRFKHYRFKSKPPRVEEWRKPPIVNNVYDIEMQQHYKSLEERLMYRMEVWIDVCRIERIINGVMTNGTGKFHSAKRFRKSDSRLSKVRSFSMAKVSAKSAEDVSRLKDFDDTRDPSDLPGPIKKRKAKRGQILSPAYSTNDLVDRSKTVEAEIINDMSAKYGTGPKRKFRFFLFFKKENKSGKNKHIMSENNGDNNNQELSGLSSGNPKTRPSLFNMESLKGSIPELEKLSVQNNVEQYEYDPDKPRQRRGSAGENKFYTIGGIPNPSHETLFQANHKDSFRSRKHKNQASLNGPVFYDPQKKEADIGHV